MKLSVAWASLIPFTLIRAKILILHSPIKEICHLLGIKKTRTTPYHPQSDGLVQHFNRTLLNTLSIAVEDDELSWDLLLPTILLAYQTSIHETMRPREPPLLS